MPRDHISRFLVGWPGERDIGHWDGGFLTKITPGHDGAAGDGPQTRQGRAFLQAAKDDDRAELVRLLSTERVFVDVTVRHLRHHLGASSRGFLTHISQRRATTHTPLAMVYGVVGWCVFCGVMAGSQ